MKGLNPEVYNWILTGAGAVTFTLAEHTHQEVNLSIVGCSFDGTLGEK